MHEGRALIQPFMRRGVVSRWLRVSSRSGVMHTHSLPASLTALEPNGVGYPVEIAVLELAAQADRLHR